MKSGSQLICLISEAGSPITFVPLVPVVWTCHTCPLPFFLLLLVFYLLLVWSMVCLGNNFFPVYLFVIWFFFFWSCSNFLHLCSLVYQSFITQGFLAYSEKPFHPKNVLKILLFEILSYGFFPFFFFILMLTFLKSGISFGGRNVIGANLVFSRWLFGCTQHHLLT